MNKAIHPLTSFRFFAALAVFIYHLPNFATGERNMWLHQGFTGVTFFFVLSGFILAYTYADRMRTLRWDQSLSFYITRFARIYPSHLVTFLLSAPLYWMDYSYNGSRALIKHAVPSVLAIQSFFPEKHIFFAYNMVSWSLSNEFFFYALFPFLLVGCQRLKPAIGRWLAIASWALAVTLVAVFSGRMVKDQAYWLFGIFPPFRLFDFLIGILLLTAFNRPASQAWSSNQHTALEILSLAALAVAYLASPLLPEPFYWGTYYLPFMAFVIWTFSFTKGTVSRALSSGWLVRLGEWSFGFYMYHHLVIWGLERSGWVFLKTYPIPSCFIAFAGTLMASALSYHIVEQPAKKWICARFRL